MNKFQEAETEGRAKFQQILDQCKFTGQPTIDQFDRVDYKFLDNKNKEWNVEIKCRDKKYEQYDTYMLEVSKYEALKQFDRALYVCFFDDVAYIFNINKIEYNIRQIYCNKTTVESTGKVKKSVIMIPKEVGVRLIFKDNKWHKE